ncbi:hypothetical protein [Desulfohalovibrio reitneri]|uniref:hypothetical protein n=1 Tax=Desulfohalovibrio reitneri TaxID=1307759 RepID=UPI00069179BF|nr:hypothetical protein [Desulfohalovibrio reitneri]
MRRLTILLAVLALTLAVGCQRKPQAPKQGLGPGAELAVAGFSNPRHEWEMLASCPLDECNIVEPAVLQDLTRALTTKLQQRERNFIPPSVVRQCQELVRFEETAGSPQSRALQYWLEVGSCVPASYIMVPQLMFYREREGGEWGAKEPASVKAYFYLIDVQRGTIVRRSHFDETQKSLSENVLDAGTFFERGGKWVSAKQLATDAIHRAVVELGL